MNYFVYFICLLCSTSLTTTMLDSYDVSETLNDFIKTDCIIGFELDKWLVLSPHSKIWFCSKSWSTNEFSVWSL